MIARVERGFAPAFPKTIKKLVPMGGSADDWAAGGRLQTLMADTAVREIVFNGAATYLAKTVFDLVALRGAAPLFFNGNGASIVSSIPATIPSAPTNSIFYICGAASGAATTLSAPTVVGSRTISTVATFAAGDVIVIDSYCLRTVVSVAGAGPYTLTLDEPMYRVIAGGQAVQKWIAPTDIRLDDFTISGTGDRAIEIGGGMRPIVSRIKCVDNTLDAAIIGFDIPTRYGLVQDCELATPAANPVAVSFERTSHCTVERTNVRGGGIVFTMGEFATANNCAAVASSSAGFLVSNESATLAHCGIGHQFIGCRALKSTNNGFQADAARDTVFAQCEADDNAGGFAIKGGSATIANCVARRNNVNYDASSSVVAGLTVANVGVLNCVSSDVAYYGVSVAANQIMRVSGLDCNLDGLGGGVQSRAILSAGDLDATGVRINHTLSAVEHAAIEISGGSARLRGVDITVGANSTSIRVTGAATKLRFDTTKTAGKYGVEVPTAGSTPAVWIGLGNDFSSSTTALLDSTTAAATFNRGTFTLDGASPAVKAVPVRGILATSRVKTWLITKGGTGTGLAPAITNSAGTGFTATSVNGDTSVWGFEVEVN